MTQVNFELVYKLRKFNTNSLNNLVIQYQNEARARAEAEHKKYTDAIEVALGHNDFQVTNIMCMADGIIGHVYSPLSEPSGVGKRVCVFCGCDDFDF